MIVYGTRSKLLATDSLQESCPHCGANNSVLLYVFQKYAHVFWIPLFPIGKIAVSQCTSCKKVSKQKELSPAALLSAENLKTQSKTPIWTFSGLAVIALIIVLTVISERNKDQRNGKLILSPQSGDVFEVKTKDQQYTLYKVDNVQGDSVYVKINNYETNKVSGISDLKRKGESAYSEELYSIHKKDLLEMLNKGEIIDIDRN
jgi:hypothetical protein